MRFFATVLLMCALATILALPMESESDSTKSGNSLEQRRRKIESRAAETSRESQSRKKRSLAILKAEKIPFTQHLPAIGTEAQSTRRSTEQVAQRAMALCIVAAKGEGVDQETIGRLVNEYKLASLFTPKEKAFIANPNPTQHDRIQFTWRYECYWVMLWALGFVDTLDRPDAICDVRHAVSFLQQNGHDGFVKKSKLRSQSEILDAADLIYRYHWAVVDARINDREPPATLDAGVVMERHYALNWLIGYMDQEWDDISTDT